MKSHIQDNHLHIVAPPGSGKTILGLEMLPRVAKPSLVLSPTVTIRHQWKSRLESFFQTDKDFDNYTLDPKNRSFLTFSTYRSLHATNKSLTDNRERLLIHIEIPNTNAGKKHVDSSRLLYTRSMKGRRALLRARLSHIVYQFKEVSKKAITWK